MKRQAIRHARGKSAFRCHSNASRFHTRLACLTGTIRLLFRLEFSRRLTSVALLIRTTVLADPTAFEEPLLETSISIVLDERGDILSASQLGVADKDTMSLCVSSAKERHGVRGNEIYSF